MRAEVYKDWTLVECVENIEQIPESLFQELCPSNFAEHTGFVALLSYCQGLTYWLKNSVLAEALSLDVVEGWPHLQPHAELWKARLDLISALYPRSELLQMSFFETPAAIWFDCINAEVKLMLMGIFTKAEITKKSYLSNQLRKIKALNGDEDKSRSWNKSFKDRGEQLYRDVESGSIPSGVQIERVRLDVDLYF
jgi:hypothetical protein